MLHISCPSCAERGKIPTNLIGARIKCKKCGNAFHVTDPSRAGAAAAAAAAGAQGPHPAFEGIAVEGLDPAAWSLAPEPSSHSMPAAPAPPAEPPPQPAAPTEPAPVGPGAAREYKLLTSRDKYFEGKFDLNRLEEALNHYARRGWAAKSMCLPHVKNFQGAMQEEVVVLLERDAAGVPGPHD